MIDEEGVLTRLIMCVFNWKCGWLWILATFSHKWVQILFVSTEMLGVSKA